MIKLYIILVIMTLLGSIASLFLKKASDRGNLIRMLKNKNIYIGGLLYLASALLNVIMLKYLDYSVVLPLTSLTYLWTILLAYIFLKERITSSKIVGICAVLLGAFLITL